MSSLKLGKKDATYSRKDLRLVDFLKKTPAQTLREAPVGFGHANLINDWGMLANDRFGDCAWAASAHMTMEWCASGGRAVPTFTDEAVLSDYAAATGFDPQTGAGDEGTVMREKMSYWRTTGVVDGAGVRHKIGAFLALEPGNFYQLLQALYLFDMVDIGIKMPSSAMEQFQDGKSWSVVPGDSIEGGHDVPVNLHPATEMLSVVTWGKEQQMTRGFYEQYSDEAWVVLDTEFIRADGTTIEGFKLDDLQEALSVL